MRVKITLLFICLFICSCAGNSTQKKDATWETSEKAVDGFDRETGSSPVEKELEQIEKERSLNSKDYPPWLLNPNIEGYIGAVGSAKMPRRGGYPAQKHLATTIAYAELAKQKSVLVEAELRVRKELGQTGEEQLYESTLHTYSRQKARELVQNAVVKDEWPDPTSGELHVWVVIEPQNKKDKE